MYNLYETYIVPGSIIIPLLIALFNYGLLDKPLKFIAFFLLFSGIVDLILVVMASHAIPNLWLINLYIIFEFAFISWFYRMVLKGRSNKTIIFLMICFTILCLVNLFFVQKHTQFNTYTRSLEAIIIIGYCIAFFSKQSQQLIQQGWAGLSLNWINVGFLCYYACTFFTFLFSNYLVIGADKNISHIIWAAQDTILMIQYLLFAVGFYKCRKQPITSLS